MDAHENEADGAIAGMADLYGKHRPELAIGDRITFSLSTWAPNESDSGRVVSVIGDRIIVGTDAGRVEITLAEVREF